MKIRTYSELSSIEAFPDRLDYLKLSGGVGRSTFGFDRYLNQQFYGSREWRDIRRFVILRDESCDLGIIDYEIQHGLVIHHMNPIRPKDILDRKESILDPEYLITTTHGTHNIIHYGGDALVPPVVAQRSPGDTKLW